MLSSGRNAAGPCHSPCRHGPKPIPHLIRGMSHPLLLDTQVVPTIASHFALSTSDLSCNLSPPLPQELRPRSELERSRRARGPLSAENNLLRWGADRPPREAGTSRRLPRPQQPPPSPSSPTLLSEHDLRPNKQHRPSAPSVSPPCPAKPAPRTPLAPSRYPLSFPCLFARILFTHPLPSLASLAGSRRTVARGAPTLRTVALATLWVPSHVCGRSGHVLCEVDAHALCLAVLRARGAEQFACRVVHPCSVVPRLPVRASRCGCML